MPATLIRPHAAPRRSPERRCALVALLALALIATHAHAETGLVGRWTFDANDGADSSGHHFDATPGGAVVFNAGRGGRVATLDGATGYLESPSNPAFTPHRASWSLTAWIAAAPTGTGDTQYAVIWYRCGANPSCGPVDAAAYGLYLDASGVPRVFLRDDASVAINLAGATSLLDGAWHFLAGTYDSTSHIGTLYVDGKSVDSVTQPLVELTSGGLNIPLSIGRNFVAGWGIPQAYFKGSLDDVRVYARALSAAEITALFTGGELAAVGPVAPRAMLGPAWPNPARGPATIHYALAAPRHARLRVLDVLGREVRVLEDADRGAGEHAVAWDGRDGAMRPAAAGVYFYRLETRALGGGAGEARVVRGTVLR